MTSLGSARIGERPDPHHAHGLRAGHERVARAAEREHLHALARAREAVERRAGAVVRHDPALAEDGVRADRLAVGRLPVEGDVAEPRVERDVRRHRAARPAPRPQHAARDLHAGHVRAGEGVAAVLEALLGRGLGGLRGLRRRRLRRHLVGAAVGRDVALVRVRPDVHHVRRAGAPASRACARRLGSSSSTIRSVNAALSPEKRRFSSPNEVSWIAKFDHTPIGRPSASSRRMTVRIGSIEASLARRLVLRDVLVALERLEVAVARGVGDARLGDAELGGHAVRVRGDDRLRDPLRGELEHARVERVAAERRVAGRVDRPDRPRRGMGVGGRDHDVLERDAGVGDQLVARAGRARTESRRGPPGRAPRARRPCRARSRAPARACGCRGSRRRSSRRGRRPGRRRSAARCPAARRPRAATARCRRTAASRSAA